MAIPALAQRWTWRMDPGDLLDFGIDFSALLEPGEQIAAGSLTVSVAAESALFGFGIDLTGGRAVLLSPDGRGVSLWFGVQAGHQGDLLFDLGVEMAVSVVFETTNVPFRRLERTFVVQVENR